MTSRTNRAIGNLQGSERQGDVPSTQRRDYEGADPRCSKGDGGAVLACYEDQTGDCVPVVEVSTGSYLTEVADRDGNDGVAVPK